MKNNYLLFMTSLMADGRGPVHYTVPGFEESFDCVQTNLPAAEYVAALLRQRGEKLTKIIMLCSKEVMEKPILLKDAAEPVTTYEYVCRTLSDYLKASGYSALEPDKLFVPFLLRDINPGDNGKMNEIMNKISEEFPEPKESELFLDFTGGLRSASMIQLFFARQLEALGLTVNYVLYSNYQTGEIENCIETYRVFELLKNFDKAQAGDTDALEAVARETKDSGLIAEAEEAAKQQRASENGRFAQGKPKTPQPTAPAAQSVGQMMTRKAIQDQQDASTRIGRLHNAVKRNNYKEASDLIREHGTELLTEAGYLIWSDNGRKGKNKELIRKNSFAANGIYYHSYLKFVQNMLIAAFSEGIDPEGFRAACDSYIDQNTRIYPAETWRATNISAIMLQEFERAFGSLMDEERDALRQKLLSAQSDSEDTAISDYSGILIRNYVTYATTGFPFGNIYQNRTYTVCGSQQYDKEYMAALNAGVERLCRIPQQERTDLLPQLTKDIFLLAEYFPTVHMKAMFSVRDGDYTAFSPHLLLIDVLRQKRNKTIHDGQNVSEDDAKKTAELVKEFSDWLDSLSAGK